MDVWHITVAALRRWYVLLPLLALTVLGAYFVGEGVHPQYEVMTTTTLVPGTTDAEVENLYGNLNDTNHVISIVVGAAPARDAIEDQGLSPDYEIDARDRSSIMRVTVLTDSRKESLDTARAVIELTKQELAQRQEAADIPRGARISLQVLDPPSVSEVVSEGKMRNMAIVGLVGASLSLLVAVLFDDLIVLVKRRPRRRRKHEASTEAPVTRSPGDPSGTVDEGSGQDHESRALAEEGGTEDLADDVSAPSSVERTGRRP